MSSLRQSYRRVASPPRSPFVRLATDTGLSTGEANAIGDYSAEAKQFWVQPDPGHVLVVGVIHIIVSDNGTPKWNEYGNLTLMLSNGIRIFLDVGGAIVYGRSLILNNADLYTAASQESFTTFASSTRLVSYSKPYFVFSDGFTVEENKNLQRIGIELNDNFVGLIRHNIVFDGYQQIASF